MTTSTASSILEDIELFDAESARRAKQREALCNDYLIASGWTFSDDGIYTKDEFTAYGQPSAVMWQESLLKTKHIVDFFEDDSNFKGGE